MDPFEEIKQTFFQECEEQLGELETGLLDLRAGDGDDETVNAVFRAVHSVKGGAGAFSLDALVAFAHVFETVLEELRSHRLEQTNDLIDVLLRASDVLVDLVGEARGGSTVDAERTTASTRELKACLGEEDTPTQAETAPTESDGATDEMAPDELGFVPQMIAIPGVEDASPTSEAEPDELGFVPQMIAIPGADDAEDDIADHKTPCWFIDFTPHNALYASANDAIILLRELARLGDIQVDLDTSKLPDLDSMEPEHAYFSWTIELHSDCSEDDIREVFEFVEDDCDLKISCTSGEMLIGEGEEDELFAETATTIVADELDQTPKPVLNDEQAFDSIRSELLGDTSQVKEAASQKADPPSESETIPAKSDPADIATNAKTASPPAKAEPAKSASSQPPAQTTIRVDLDRVDILIDLVGELVINQAMLAQHSQESGFSRAQGVGTGLDELERLTREIQDSVMAIRAQPVKSVFVRMPRLVREVSAMTGKKVRLETEGEGTEVDKTVIEKLTDPLTHMIRNAIDHGLETPEKRIAAGKPEEGVVKLSANHRSGRIVIEVEDDGAGINRPKVRQIAIDKGILSPTAELSDDEIDNLIFKPGFSTATEVSNISGRGVGMDVVRSSIEALGGRISISSQPGKGSVFTMSLPLTLAVLDGMVVTIGEQALIAPLNNVVETLRPQDSQIKFLGPNERVVALRDQHVPMLDLGLLMGFRDEPAETDEGVCLLVENDSGAQVALQVDDILGQRQVVIKSLEQNYKKVDLIAAATILGDGRVALIADIDAVITARHKDRDPDRNETQLPTSLAS